MAGDLCLTSASSRLREASASMEVVGRGSCATTLGRTGGAVLRRRLLAVTAASAIALATTACTAGSPAGSQAPVVSTVDSTPMATDPAPEEFAGRVYQVTSLSVDATGVLPATVPDAASALRNWAGFWDEKQMAGAERLVAQHFGDVPFETRLVRGGYGWWVIGTDGVTEVGACNQFDGGNDLMPRDGVLYDGEALLEFFRAQLAEPG